jgi:hypothetical protein
MSKDVRDPCPQKADDHHRAHTADSEYVELKELFYGI